MAGGSGTRLWPLSRENFPKQVLQLIGDRTMFQQSIDRIISIFPLEQIWIIASPELCKRLHDQVPELLKKNFIIEPEGRGTAPAIGLAGMHLFREDPEAVMTVLTADHFIGDVPQFQKALVAAESVARKGFLTTLGIKPSNPSTGYGYIELGEFINEIGGFSVFHAKRFTEKPDRNTAEKMIASGRYSWNSGMFIWEVKRIMQEYERQMPELISALIQIESAFGKMGYPEILQKVWSRLEKKSVDYGIMEGATNTAIIPIDIGWIDIGSWESLIELLGKDDQGNTVVGLHLGIDTHNNLIYGNKRLITTIGIQDFVIVDTEDAVLVCPIDRVQEIRELVKLIKESGKSQWL